MTCEIGDQVQSDRDRGVIVVGTVTSVKGCEPYRVCGVRGPGVPENYLIPERFVRTAPGATRC